MAYFLAKETLDRVNGSLDDKEASIRACKEDLEKEWAKHRTEGESLIPTTLKREHRKYDEFVGELLTRVEGTSVYKCLKARMKECVQGGANAAGMTPLVNSTPLSSIGMTYFLDLSAAKFICRLSKST